MSQQSLPMPPRSLLARESILAAVLLGLTACLAPVAYGLGEVTALRAELTAASMCLLTFAGALAVSHWLRAPAKALAGMLLAMGIRTGVPLLLLVLFHLHGGLDRGGLLYYVLTFYFVALALETWLSLPRPDRVANESSSQERYSPVRCPDASEAAEGCGTESRIA